MIYYCVTSQIKILKCTYDSLFVQIFINYFYGIIFGNLFNFKYRKKGYVIYRNLIKCIILKLIQFIPTAA